MDKKKRHTSGSRSKSKKSKPNDFSVDLKPQKGVNYLGLTQQQSKTKTQNSINKSKGTTNSKKQSKILKKPIKQSKIRNNINQDMSHSVSADRKHSLNKINRTQANYFQSQDIQRKIYTLKKSLNRINKPYSIDFKQMEQYYHQIQDSIETVSQPLYSILIYLHSLYLQPFYVLMDAMTPYSDLIKKKQQVSKQIQIQVKQNQKLYKQLDPQNLQILKLKQQVQQLSKIIQQKKNKKLQKQQLQNKNKKQKIKNIQQQNKKINNNNNNIPSQGIGNKGFKLDLDHMSKHAQGFHDQFYSKLDQFSQSWRNQAIRQKRF